jgi:hypothetical protein
MAQYPAFVLDFHQDITSVGGVDHILRSRGSLSRRKKEIIDVLPGIRGRRRREGSQCVGSNVKGRGEVKVASMRLNAAAMRVVKTVARERRVSL